MDRLQALRVFTRVARLGSFSAAARELGMSAAAVSRNVSRLESDLGTELLHRTTRSVSQTDAGRRCLERAEAIIADMDALDDVIRGEGQGPRGQLRVTAGVSISEKHLGAAFARFQHLHPDLQLEVILTDEVVDLVKMGIDLAVRTGRLEDSSLRARRISTVNTVLACSPDYADEHAIPSDPHDLLRHDLLLDTNLPRRWTLDGPDDERVALDVEGSFAVNSARVIRDACREGLGIALVPTFMCGDDLKSGRLVRVLPEWTGPAGAMFAVYPGGRHVRTAVRQLIDALVEDFGGAPRWDEGVGGRLAP